MSTDGSQKTDDELIEALTIAADCDVHTVRDLIDEIDKKIDVLRDRKKKLEKFVPVLLQQALESEKPAKDKKRTRIVDVQDIEEKPPTDFGLNQSKRKQHEPSDLVQEIAQIIREHGGTEGLTISAIENHSGRPYHSIYSAVKSAGAKGIIERVGDESSFPIRYGLVQQS